MKSTWMERLVLALVLAATTIATVEAGGFGKRAATPRSYSTNVGYYDPAWGNAPHSLITPPNSRRHIEYQQGVGSAMNQPIYRDYPGVVRSGGPFTPMSSFPYSTNHMGVYYLRSPH